MQSKTKKTLKYFLKASLQYKRSGLLMVLSIVLASALGVIVPLFFKSFFDGLVNGQTQGQLVQTLIYIVSLNLAAWAFWRVAFFSITEFQTKVIRDLTNQCFEYLHKHSHSFFENSFAGALVKRVKWFARSFEVIADQIVWSFLPLAVNISIISFVLFKRNFILGLAVLLWTIIFLFINFIFSKFKLKYDLERAKKETESTAILADTITNQLNVKLFNGYKREVFGFKKVMDDWHKISRFSWNLGGIMDAFQGLFMVGLEAGVLYIAITLWQKKLITIGDFALIQSYLITIFHRVWDFGKVIRRIYESLADANEMTEILETPHEITDIYRAKKLKVREGKIELKDVCFDYQKTRNILKNFNLTIQPKEKVALVGPSGAGKTTIVRLFLRMHNLSAGAILIDNQDIAKVTGESLWESIALVPQDPILFHRTLMENIRYGSINATDKQAKIAAQKAFCSDFIEKLDNKYQTYVGERGIKLSGGERQRVAIARAILKNPSILILDEATSSLDSASEKLIQKAIQELMANKTVVVIAHRLSTIQKMDRIIVIDEGKIVEEGKHSDLIQKPKGVYRNLWQIQAGGFIDQTLLCHSEVAPSG